MVEMYSVYPNKSLENKIKVAFSNTNSCSPMNYVLNLHNAFQPTLLLQSYQCNQLVLYVEIRAFIYIRAEPFFTQRPDCEYNNARMAITVPGCLDANVVPVLNGGLSKLTSCLKLNRLSLQSGFTQTTVNFNIIFVYLDI